MIKKLGLIFLFAILLCSCSNNEKAINSKFDLDINSFTQLDKSIIKVEIKSDKKIDDIDAFYNVTTVYDINSDGKLDNIKATLGRRNVERDSLLQVNGESINLMIHNPGEVYLVDLNKNDKFIEIAIYDDGPSGDPSYSFYKYNGKEIISLGDVSMNDYNILNIDGNGRFLLKGGFLQSISPKIILGINKLSNDEIQSIKYDYSDELNKEYTVECEQLGYFKEMDNVPDDFTPSWSEDDMKKYLFKVEKGEKIILKKIGNYEWYELEFSNGKKGVLYFWSGD